MNSKPVSTLDKKLAEMCRTCPLCRHARKKQHGGVYRFVKSIEGHICPACRAYERVYGKKAHEQ